MLKESKVKDTYHRLKLIYRVKVVTGFLSLLVVSMPSFADKSALFSEYSIDLPFSLTQPVLAANLLENTGNELIAFGVTEQGERQLAVYAFDPIKNKMELIDLLSLENGLFAYDLGVTQLNGLQSLYFLSNQHIFEYRYSSPELTTPAISGPVMAAPNSQTSKVITKSRSNLTAILKVSSLYLSDYADALMQMDFSQDINDDHQDDFILSQFEAVKLWLSQANKVEFILQSLAIPALLKVDGKNVTFKPRDLFFNDMNADNKTDIVLVESGHLLVFLQNEQSDFNSEGVSISLASDIEGINWWDKIDADGQQLDQSQLHHKMVETITDINGDKLPDLIVRFTQSSGVLDRTNDYEFYYGRLLQQKLQFETQADTRIFSKSTLSDLKLVDLDNDGRQEIMLSAFDLGVSQIISALLSSSIEQEVYIYKMDENQYYPSKPTLSQEVEITFSLSSGRSGEPMVKVQDINGDGLKDIIFSEEDDQIKVIYALNDSKRLFSRKSEKYKVKVPKNAKSITHSDVNLDDKMDLILHYSRADSPELLNKVIVLIAN
jgi:hypothetical protein